MDRKYRQNGYMDSDHKSRESRPKHAPNRGLSQEERIQRRSLRHAIDREAREVVRCHVCGRSIQALDVIKTETDCPFCHAPLHCCRTCLHFDSAVPRQCRTEIAVAVGDKNKANSCEQHSPRLVLDSTGRRSNTPHGAGGPREAFENLFKR